MPGVKRRAPRVGRLRCAEVRCGRPGSADGTSCAAAESARSLAPTLRAFSSALRRPTRGQDQEQERPLPPSAPSPASGGREALIGWGLGPPALALRGPPWARRGRGGKSPQGGRQEAGQFAVRPWMACQRTSAASSRSRPQADRARGGALLFGYFLLGKQEKVTRAHGCAWNPQGRESVFAKSRRSNWIPAFAGMAKVGLFAGMTKWKVSTQ